MHRFLYSLFTHFPILPFETESLDAAEAGLELTILPQFLSAGTFSLIVLFVLAFVTLLSLVVFISPISLAFSPSPGPFAYQPSLTYNSGRGHSLQVSPNDSLSFPSFGMSLSGLQGAYLNSTPRSATDA